MKPRTIKRLIFCAAAGTLFFACEKANELPPLNEGYKTTYVMPEATFLTDEDRAFIEMQEKEYALNGNR